MTSPSFAWFKTKRRLLALVLVILANLLLFGYPGPLLFFRLRDAWAARSREVSAAERVEALGAKVHWDHGTVLSVAVEKGKFPDDMVNALSELSGLKGITVWVDAPSDPAIAKLTKLRHLGAIEFSGPGISDTTIECLKDVRGLKHVSLGGFSVITDAGLFHFAAFASLEYLRIDGGTTTDAGMAHLKNLRNLKGLDLRNSAVTDAGIAQLKGLKQLKTLRLYECKQITAQGVQALQASLRNTQIGWDKCAIPGDLF
jgi:hypothetical protein